MTLNMKLKRSCFYLILLLNLVWCNLIYFGWFCYIKFKSPKEAKTFFFSVVLLSRLQFVNVDEISVHGLQTYHTKPNHILMEMLVVLLLLNGGKGLFSYLLAHLSLWLRSLMCCLSVLQCWTTEKWSIIRSEGRIMVATSCQGFLVFSHWKN